MSGADLNPAGTGISNSKTVISERSLQIDHNFAKTPGHLLHSRAMEAKAWKSNAKNSKIEQRSFQ